MRNASGYSWKPETARNCFSFQPRIGRGGVTCCGRAVVLYNFGMPLGVRTPDSYLKRCGIAVQCRLTAAESGDPDLGDGLPFPTAIGPQVELARNSFDPASR